MSRTEPNRMASRTILLAVAAFGLSAAEAGAIGTPALVVDAASGKVLLAERATEPWFPASITKLMTAYVALDLVRRGRASMNSLLTMSAEAAREPPSKMGFKPGSQLTLDNALKIIMVKSANDVSAMIAENLGGSVDGFAGLMNEASRRLGMHESRWANPHGLPDERQQTSARDMVILARALLAEFPDQEDLFRIGAIKLGSKVIRNHNGLLGRYPGANGMKTGFICAGGFNVVASATQNGRRLIAVVMGFPSARERDLRAANLFDKGFSSYGWGGQPVEQLPPSGTMTPANMRPFVCGPKKRIPQEDEEPAAVSLAAVSGNSDNPIAALFAPAALASAGAGGVQIPGARTSLGPRVAFEPIPVAFEPIPVWLGPSPGAVPDEGDVLKPARVRIAAKPVRTRLVGSAAKPLGAISGSVSAAPPAVAPAIPGGASVTPIKTTARAGGRSALATNLEAKPAAEAKPKLGAIGGTAGGRAKHGSIALKPNLPVAALESVEIRPAKKKPPAKTKPQAAAKAKPQASARAKPAAAAE